MVAARPIHTESSPTRPTLWLVGDRDLRETHAHVSTTDLRGDEDAVTAWRRAIAGYPLLSAADERRLAARMRGGPADSVTARAARQRLWESTLRWSYQLATWYATARVPLEDLAQVAALAIWHALPGYDPAKGRLTTYVTAYVIRDLRRMGDEYASPIRRPQYVLTRERRVYRVAAQHEAEHGVAPSLALLAAALDMPPEVTEDVLAQVARSRETRVVSLDRQHRSEQSNVVWGDGGSLAETLADDDLETDPVEMAERRERQARIAQLVAALLPTEGVSAQTARKHLRMRVVLARYYGDDRRYYGKLAPIAKELKLTRERVRQIREEAIRILRGKAATTAGRELLALWTES